MTSWKNNQKKQNLPLFWRHPPKTPKPNLKRFIFQCRLEDFTSISRVRIALMFSRRVIAIRASHQRETHVFYAIFWFWGKMGFGGYNFGSRHARRSIKRSIDADDHLVSKKILSQKNGSLDWRPVKVGQKLKNTPTLWPPPRTPNPNQKKFF